MICLQLFISFLQVGLFSVGGGYAAIPLIQAQVVDRFGWLSMQEFTNLITIAEMTPGPIAVNSATFVGIRLAGIGGAVIATLGCILPSLVIVTLLSCLYRKYGGADAVQSILSCLRPAVVALIASAGLSILLLAFFGGKAVTLSNVNWVSVALFTAALLALRVKKWSPILVMAGCGVMNLLFQLATGGV